MRGRPSDGVTILGRNIKRLCQEKGITQKDVADECEVGISTFSRWVCGADPRLSTLIRIADALDVSLDELAGRHQGG